MKSRPGWLEPLLLLALIALLASHWHSQPPAPSLTPTPPAFVVEGPPPNVQLGNREPMKAGLAIHGIVLGETLSEARVQFHKYHMIETELDRLGSGNAYIRLALRDDQAQQTPGLIVTFKNEHVVHLEGDDIENNLPAVGRQLATINLRARGAPRLFGEPLEEHHGVYTYRIVGVDRIIARLQIAYDRHNLARRFSLKAWDAPPDPMELPLQ